MWTKYLSLASFVYNTFNSPNLGNYSPYELTFGRKPKLLLNMETNPDIKVSRNFREYYDSLNKRIKYLQDLLFNFRSWRLAMINKSRENFQYRGGDLVLYYLTFDKSIKNKLPEDSSKICRSSSNLQNSLTLTIIYWWHWME